MDVNLEGIPPDIYLFLNNLFVLLCMKLQYTTNTQNEKGFFDVKVCPLL